jgi:hypothetical protein
MAIMGEIGETTGNERALNKIIHINEDIKA